ncbi:response regulator [candidate division KSB1 bacterium]
MKKILIVDDDKQVLEGLKRILVSNGYFAECAENAVDALESIKKSAFDLLIIDLILPKMDGIELIKQINRISGQYKIIMITGHPSSKYEEEAKKLGVAAYLIKPFSIDNLIENVRRALS